MSTDQLKQFAAELKTAREEANLTLHMLYQRTRVDIKYLQAIENGDFDVIDEVFLRAFIKGYAKNVGLDEQQVIKKYDLARSGRLQEKEEDKEEEKQAVEETPKTKVVFTSETVSGPHYNSPPKSKIDARLIIIAGLIIALLSVIYIAYINNNSTEIIKESSVTGNVQSEKQADRFELTAAPDTAEAAPASSVTDSLRLKILGVAPTWIRVTTDRDQQTEFTIQVNESRVITADSLFNLLIGNAGGIKLELNNKALEQVGKPGEIKSIHINSSGIKYMRIKPEEK